MNGKRDILTPINTSIPRQKTHRNAWLSALRARAKREPIGYIAAPIDTYNTPEYNAARDAILRERPGVYWVQPANLDWRNDDWLRSWPRIVPLLSALAVIPRPDGSIGLGVWTEIHDCRARGNIGFCFWLDGELVNSDRPELIGLARLPGNSWHYYAKVVRHVIYQ